MQIIRKQELKTKLWKNGGGVTREIASATRNGRMVFRLSMADLAKGGPFSDFSGLTRILTVIQGGNMRLHTEQQVFHADLWEPVKFDGALKITAELVDQPLTDFNLMFAPDQCDGTVSILRGATCPGLAVEASQIVAVHVLAGEAVFANDTRLYQGDTGLLTDQAAFFHFLKKPRHCS